MIILIFCVACTVRAGERNCRAAVVFMPWKFNLKGIGIPDDALRSHSQNKRTTGKIRGLKEVGNDGEDGNGVVLVFEAVQGINVETALFC